MVVSFFTRDRTLVRWAVITFALIIVQGQLLPDLARHYPVFGALHGLNALLVFTAAVLTWRKARVPAAAAEMSMAT